MPFPFGCRWFGTWNPKRLGCSVLSVRWTAYPSVVRWFRLAIRIASYIEDELHYRWLKTEHNEVFHYAAKDVEKDSKRSYRRKVDAFMRHERGEAKKGNMERWKTWSRRDKVAMGTWLLELIRTTTHYIAFNMIGERQKTVMYVTATDDLFAWIQRYNADQEVLRPLWLPTVEAPKDWVSVWRGGYDPDAGLPPLTLIKTHDMDYLRGLNTEDMKPVTDAVNHVQSTAWRVNEKVLEVARWAWDNDREIGEMCRRSDYELPPFPARASEDKELKKEYSRKCGTIHNLNLSMRSQRLHIIKTLWMAASTRVKVLLPAPTRLSWSLVSDSLLSFTPGNGLSQVIALFRRDSNDLATRNRSSMACHSRCESIWKRQGDLRRTSRMGTQSKERDIRSMQRPDNERLVDGGGRALAVLGVLFRMGCDVGMRGKGIQDPTTRCNGRFE